MKKSSKYLIALVSGVMLTTGLVACSWHHKTPEEKADYLVEKATKKLDLTEEQVIELHNLKDDLLDVREDFADKREQTHATLEELLSQPTLDQQRLVAVVREHTAVVNQQTPQIVSSIAGFYDSLSPEQQAKLRDKIAKHHERSHRWHY